MGKPVTAPRIAAKRNLYFGIHGCMRCIFYAKIEIFRKKRKAIAFFK